MRSAVVNMSSPKEEVWGVLSGVWNEYDAGNNKEFRVVKTPFYVAMSATLEAGTHILPVTPNGNALLRWASATQSGNIVIHAKDPTFTLPVNAFIEVTLYGTAGTSV